jgi:organic hydroperoxide reductase OsmC/OhrA
VNLPLHPARVATGTLLCDRNHFFQGGDEVWYVEVFSLGLLTLGNMAEFHHYRIKAWWTFGRTGIANCDSAPNALHFTAPPQFGGLEGRWTPEDLLLTAIGSCFATTFRALADYSKLAYKDLEVEVAGTVQKADSGYSFKEIATRPQLTLVREGDQPSALRLLHKAQELCLIARSLAIRHTFEPSIAADGSDPQARKVQ